MLATRGRISPDRPVAQWIRAALRIDERIIAVPPDTDVAIGAALLGDRGFPGDPADRFIFATATARDAMLVTRDTAMHRFDDRLRPDDRMSISRDTR